MVIHVASPFEADGSTEENKDEQYFIKPAVEGTMAVMNAVAKTPSVKRVVLTSSCVAIMDNGKEKPTTYDNTDWSIPEKQTGYFKSKTLAEKAAWDFLKTPEGAHINLVTINPGLVVGPPLTPSSTGSVQYVS